ncbi:hypothetical protein CFP65_2509 [Kitasatospora sp. MMS16-BH015]|uniref:hypothetical protein n=1 Tax=Kitasatospora sp. MMS16-BH015 TaxID=2018025 RepID=UPI000CA3AC96|nr:hypothetical protein [Kitasatospora sp. MMS16-BH015]AUG77338.1 hypothetical protein CFP65_2509 [Kitasatospora sp. MMS16-BH015]
MRANHATEPEATAAPSVGRPGGRLPRPRALAAGGAVLAQVWGLGFGLCPAYAAVGDPTTDLVSRADTPALLDQLTSDAVPLVERQTEPVGRVLHERIRQGGLPLPGQATTVPDAFAIAAVLLPSVPPQPRGDDPARASRSLQTGSDSRRPTDQAAAAPRTGEGAGTQADPAVGAPAPTSDGAPRPAASPVLVPAQYPVGSVGPAGPQDLTLATTATPVERGDDYTAVLVPIAAGLLLTGAAMYKHRGLPRGH